MRPPDMSLCYCGWEIYVRTINLNHLYENMWWCSRHVRSLSVSFYHIFLLQSFHPLYYHLFSSFLSSLSQSFSHWEVMPCGCCASRSVSEPLLRSDRVASLVTSALILPHVKTNPVLTLADQYSSSRAGENATRGRRLKAHSQSGSRWRLLHKHWWGKKNVDSISDKPRCSGVLITASSDAWLPSKSRMKMFIVQNTQRFIVNTMIQSPHSPHFLYLFILKHAIQQLQSN